MGLLVAGCVAEGLGLGGGVVQVLLLVGGRRWGRVALLLLQAGSAVELQRRASLCLRCATVRGCCTWRHAVG